MRRIRIGIVAEGYEQAANEFATQYGQDDYWDYMWPEQSAGGVTYRAFTLHKVATQFRLSQDPDGTYYVWVP
jgi:hypothetical protein